MKLMTFRIMEVGSTKVISGKPFDKTHPLIIPFKLEVVTSYFDYNVLSAQKYEKKDIQELHLTLGYV